MFAATGDTARADLDALDLVMAPSVRYGLMEKYQAAVQAKAAGVPWRTIMTDIAQFTPEMIARMEAERMSDAILFPEVATSTAAETPQGPPPGTRVTAG